VLESTDFAASDLEAELTARVRQEQLRRHLDIGDPAAVVAGLRAAIETPLGPLVDDVRLSDIGRADRLDEMVFEMPMVGGDTPTIGLTVLDIGSLLRTHLPADDVLAGYAERLSDPTLQPVLRGYLAGSVDLVLRTVGAGGTQRFAVIDYKTNWLGVDGEELSAWHYRPAALAHEMQRAHYPLQALLYTCALHRYLRWRLPGYDPSRNLAGVLYLFVRGMARLAAPRVDGQPCGVFAWRPPAALVVGLSDLLDRGDAAA
jgi:exodeoxyribonuclease V beta subunit